MSWHWIPYMCHSSWDLHHKASCRQAERRALALYEIDRLTPIRPCSGPCKQHHSRIITTSYVNIIRQTAVMHNAAGTIIACMLDVWMMVVKTYQQ